MVSKSMASYKQYTIKVEDYKDSEQHVINAFYNNNSKWKGCLFVYDDKFYAWYASAGHNVLYKSF